RTGVGVGPGCIDGRVGPARDAGRGHGSDHGLTRGRRNRSRGGRGGRGARGTLGTWTPAPSLPPIRPLRPHLTPPSRPTRPLRPTPLDRKSTRLNSSHVSISYAVF